MYVYNSIYIKVNIIVKLKNIFFKKNEEKFFTQKKREIKGRK